MKKRNINPLTLSLSPQGERGFLKNSLSYNGGGKGEGDKWIERKGGIDNVRI